MSDDPGPTDHARHSERLVALLGLTEPPVAMTFHADPNAAGPRADAIGPQPAGCCFWEPAQQQRIDTVAADHAHCSVGSYTHGFVPLEQAAAGADTAALVGSGWVTEADLMAAPAVPVTPSAVIYQPLAEATEPDVALIRVTPTSLMTLSGALPGLTLTGKPQCAIVPLAVAGRSSVSPGCAVSRTRTRLPGDALTAAVPAADLPGLVERLEASAAADRAVTAFAADDLARNFSPAR